LGAWGDGAVGYWGILVRSIGFRFPPFPLLLLQGFPVLQYPISPCGIPLQIDEDRLKPGDTIQPGLRRNGPFWLTFSAMLFAVMAVSVRLASKHGIPGAETTFIRFLSGLLTIAVLHSTGLMTVRLRRMPLLAARGISGGIAILLYFASLSAAKGPGGTSLTSSVFLGNSYFLYLPLLGMFFIHERLRIGTVVMVVLAVGGLYLIVNPHFGHVRAGDVYGFFGGVMSATAMVVVRELRKTEPAISVFSSLCVFGALCALITMFFQRPVWPDAYGWLLLLIMGMSATAGQLTMTYGMGFTGVGEAGILQMSTVVYSSLVAIIWLADAFSPRILLGAVLVLASAAYISYTESRQIAEPSP
jgi:drug/metabolite transporter (DMT)-like permease